VVWVVVFILCESLFLMANAEDWLCWLVQKISISERGNLRRSQCWIGAFSQLWKELNACCVSMKYLDCWIYNNLIMGRCLGCNISVGLEEV